MEAKFFSNAKMIIKDLFVTPDHPNRIAAYVNFTTAFKSGEGKNMNPDGKIQHVEVIYDAPRARYEWNRSG